MRTRDEAGPVLNGMLCTSSKAEASGFRGGRAAIGLNGVLGMCLGCRAAREGEGKRVRVVGRAV